MMEDNHEFFIVCMYWLNFYYIWMMWNENNSHWHVVINFQGYRLRASLALQIACYKICYLSWLNIYSQRERERVKKVESWSLYHMAGAIK